MTNVRYSEGARRAQRGLTLVEVLVAVALLAVLLVPAIHALHTGYVGAEAHANYSRNHYRLVSRLESVLSESYDSLEAAAAGPLVASNYSDTAGPTERVLVYFAAYDADNADGDDDPFTGTDLDMLWVRVAIDGSVQDLVSLTARP